ncbi:MAG: two-component system, cell cycle response regulator [Acidobacteriota bacterium]|jgi:diguanylate cyclase (GGDEF)-like protein/PAS domain S-box-containing protein|nr:two-component system, cell cycle response regulator [Acidobacteriota bacterium]
MRVLIAEDDMVSRRVLEATLVKWGHEVVVASDGDAALVVLESADAPTLAILDWMMPGMDGVEVCRRARQSSNATPTYIILLTAKTEKEDVVVGLEAGADDYLTKPFSRVELRARIEVGARVIKLQKGLAGRVEELNLALTERERAAESLRASESRYRHLVEHSQGLICTQDLAGMLLSVNPAAARLLGYQPDEMVGRNLSEFVAPSHQHLFNLYLERIRQQATDSGLLHIVTKSGVQRIWQYDNLRYEEAGREPYVLGHAQDVTELKEAEATMRNLSLTDELTGLYNQRGFLALAEQQLRAARRTGQSFSLLYADMDGLKQINDTYGHQEGSQALEQLAEILRKSFRGADTIARLGGDEFAILVADTTPSSIEIPLARLDELLLYYNLREFHDYQLSLSVGAVRINSMDESSVADLLMKADQAMYKNKKRKRQAALLTGARREEHFVLAGQVLEPALRRA